MRPEEELRYYYRLSAKALWSIGLSMEQYCDQLSGEYRIRAWNHWYYLREKGFGIWYKLDKYPSDLSQLGYYRKLCMHACWWDSYLKYRLYSDSPRERKHLCSLMEEYRRRYLSAGGHDTLPSPRIP